MSELIVPLNDWSAAWATAMVAIAWQSAVLAIAVGAVCWLLRWQSPALRYALWLALALKLLVMPLWTVSLPGPTGWPWAESLPVAASDSELLTNAPLPADSTDLGLDDGPIVAAEAVSVPRAAEEIAAATWYRSATPTTWLALLWASVIAFEIGRVGWQLAGLRRMLATSTPAEPAVEIVVEQSARAIGLRRLPQVRVVAAEGSPMVCGLRRPTLILPAGLLEEIDRPALRQIVLHELAHLQRRDLLTVWIIQAVRTAYWFNPVAHWVAYRAGLERELACDRLAMVNSGVSASAYAHTLIDAAGGRTQPLALNAAIAARITG